MKSILLFVAASLMLVGARIAVVIPTLLKRTQTLHDAKILVALSALASDKKVECKRSLEGISGDVKCSKVLK